MKKQRKIYRMFLIMSSILLLLSISVNIYFGICYIQGVSYLQNIEEIYNMESGILRNNLEFHDGEEYEIQYDFSHENYELLKSKYKLENIAKNGTEFEKTICLMNEYASRLTHKSDYDNHILISALDLLEYSLDNKNHGINCRNKAQILNEMCLSIGIYARKVWINPYSYYDNDCHVVNEIWDCTLNKWIMVDITNNEYWVDENNRPLSILEIRNKVTMHDFCTPVIVGEKTNNLQKLKEKHIDDFLYIVKNMVYIVYCTKYTVRESENLYMLLPQNIPTTYEWIIGKNAVEKSPINSFF